MEKPSLKSHTCDLTIIILVFSIAHLKRRRDCRALAITSALYSNHLPLGVKEKVDDFSLSLSSQYELMFIIWI